MTYRKLSAKYPQYSSPQWSVLFTSEEDTPLWRQDACYDASGEDMSTSAEDTPLWRQEACSDASGQELAGRYPFTSPSGEFLVTSEEDAPCWWQEVCPEPIGQDKSTSKVDPSRTINFGGSRCWTHDVARSGGSRSFESRGGEFRGEALLARGG